MVKRKIINFYKTDRIITRNDMSVVHGTHLFPTPSTINGLLHTDAPDVEVVDLADPRHLAEGVRHLLRLHPHRRQQPGAHRRPAERFERGGRRRMPKI